MTDRINLTQLREYLESEQPDYGSIQVTADTVLALITVVEAGIAFYADWPPDNVNPDRLRETLARFDIT